MTDENGPIDVLLVEDNPGDVRLVQEAFKEERTGSEFHVVTDGESALEFLRREDEYRDAPRTDLVLLDLNLPRIDGLAVLEQIRDDPELTRLPVVILTSSAVEEDVRRSYELHANAYLTKPVDPEAFIDLLRTVEAFWFERVHLPSPD